MSTIYAKVTQNQRSSYKDIVIDQGSTYSDTIILKNTDDTAFDLTDYSVRGKLRRSASSSTSVDFACTITDATAGKFKIELSSVDTAGLTTQNYMTTIYHYDVEIYDSETIPTVYRVLKGRAFIEPEITR